MNFWKKSFFLVLMLIVSCVCGQAQETSGVKGRIFNERQRAIPGVTVTAQQDGKNVKSGLTDKNGKFALSDLKSGKYTFIFSKNGFTTGSLANVEIGGKDLRDLGDKMLTIDEGFLVLIQGSVFDQDGRSVWGAKIEIEKLSGDKSAALPKPIYTGRMGEFLFRFPEGSAKFRVTASAKSKSASKEIEVDSAARYRLALTLNIAEKSKKEQE